MALLMRTPSPWITMNVHSDNDAECRYPYVSQKETIPAAIFFGYRRDDKGKSFHCPLRMLGNA